MKRRDWWALGALFILAPLLSGCGVIAEFAFPVWPRRDFEEPPAEPGPFQFAERRVEIEDGADRRPVGFTIFEPQTEGARPAFIWTLGSNNRAYFHQAFHENLASWGYVVIVPDTRPLSFVDFCYHRRLLQIGTQAYDLALDGTLGVNVDPERIGFGGFSVGGSIAAFCAAERPGASALVFWAPSPSPIWYGAQPDDLFPEVTQPALYILGELDITSPPDEWPQEMQARMPHETAEEVVIEGAIHVFFQQVGEPRGDPETGLTLEQQQRVAITTTRQWLDEQFGLTQE